MRHTAWIGQQLAGVFEQDPQLGFGMRRTEVLQDPLTSAGVLRDLHRRRARGRADPPDERHPATLSGPRVSASNSTNPTAFAQVTGPHRPEPSRREPSQAAYDEFTAHEYIALAPIWQAWQKFFPDEGLPIPHTFSRNATAHTVSAKQYTKRNAVQGLMIASSLIYFFDREALRVEAA